MEDKGHVDPSTGNYKVSCNRSPDKRSRNEMEGESDSDNDNPHIPKSPHTKKPRIFYKNNDFTQASIVYEQPQSNGADSDSNLAQSSYSNSSQSFPASSMGSTSNSHQKHDHQSRPRVFRRSQRDHLHQRGGSGGPGYRRDRGRRGDHYGHYDYCAGVGNDYRDRSGGGRGGRGGRGGGYGYNGRGASSGGGCVDFSSYYGMVINPNWSLEIMMRWLPANEARISARLQGMSLFAILDGICRLNGVDELTAVKYIMVQFVDALDDESRSLIHLTEFCNNNNSGLTDIFPIFLSILCIVSLLYVSFVSDDGELIKSINLWKDKDINILNGRGGISSLHGRVNKLVKKSGCDSRVSNNNNNIKNDTKKSSSSKKKRKNKGKYPLEIGTLMLYGWCCHKGKVKKLEDFLRLTGLFYTITCFYL